MKEITTELKLSVTLIEQCDDEQATAIYENTHDAESLRKVAEGIKEVLGADKVDVLGVKIFERDMTEEETME